MIASMPVKKLKTQKIKVAKKEQNITATISKPKAKESKTENTPKITPYTGSFLNSLAEKVTNFKPSKTFFTILIIVGIVALVIVKKDWFIAAMVNGQPVSNLDLQIRLNKQYRTQTLQQMINEKLILDEANKNNAIPTEAEVDTKIAEVETSVGGKAAFDSLLSQQGQDRNSVRSQVKLQLAIEKLYKNDATVSAQEVEKFIETNRDYLKATDSASQKSEAENLLKQQKLSQIFSQKFEELKKKANIQTF